MLRPDVRSTVELEREAALKRRNACNKTSNITADLFTTRLVILPLLRLENLLPYPIKVLKRAAV